MSELLTVGVTHRTAPVALRERLALPNDGAGHVLSELAAGAGSIHELVAISTCNRTEVTVLAADAAAARAGLVDVLARRGGVSTDDLEDVLFTLSDDQVARHLFRVASGLDSMVIGEAEILGQVRRAHELARSAGTSGPTLDRLFGDALATGGRVRAETTIGHGAMSISSLAAQVAERELGDLKGRNVVIIGAGETAELAAAAFHQRGVAALFVANRRATRAMCLAARFEGGVASLDRLPEMLTTADVVVAATASPHPILHRDAVAEVLPEREGRPLLLIDLAVPRDIEPSVGELEGVTRYDLDGLGRVIARNQVVREVEAGRAEGIVDDERERFGKWMATRGVAPTIAEMHRQADEIVERVLQENAGRWESASSRDRARIEAMARAVATRILHEPTIRLRSLDPAAGHRRVEILRELFGLDGEVEDGAEADAAVADRLGHGPVR
ncbi:MAG: glutamyl-tRNA reductase [Solirubrobacteraceae bacterium]|nr:glutamyl-tRNA reductase [Solirubrobacteraceae bacterium]